MFGYFFFSSRSWLMLPATGWSQVSAVPSTLEEASYVFW